MYLTPHRNNLGIINNCICNSILCICNVSIYSYMGSTGFTKTSCVTVLLFPLCVVLFYNGACYFHCVQCKKSKLFQIHVCLNEFRQVKKYTKWSCYSTIILIRIMVEQHDHFVYFHYLSIITGDFNDDQNICMSTVKTMTRIWLRENKLI